MNKKKKYVRKRDICLKYIPLLALFMFFIPAKAGAIGVSPISLDFGEIFFDQTVSRNINIVRKNPSEEQKVNLELTWDEPGFGNINQEFVLPKGEADVNIPIILDLRKLKVDIEYTGSYAITEKDEGGEKNVLSGARGNFKVVPVKSKTINVKIDSLSVKQEDGTKMIGFALGHEGTYYGDGGTTYVDYYGEKGGELLDTQQIESVSDQKYFSQRTEVSVPLPTEMLSRDSVYVQARWRGQGKEANSDLLLIPNNSNIYHIAGMPTNIYALFLLIVLAVASVIFIVIVAYIFLKRRK